MAKGHGSNDGEPFHMQELDDDTPVLPVEMEKDAGNDEDTQYIDLGHIQTDPKINYAEYQSMGTGLNSIARVTEDGRIVVSLDLKKTLPELPKDYAQDVREFAVDKSSWRDVPPLSIVIMIVGSRGDVQPYVALGQRLKKDGHRVRIATHETFESFVRDSDLEFFSIGGNPQDLMSYMVKNPGLMPGFESLTNGDIGRKRIMLKEMIEGCWRSCYEPDASTSQTFAADAIIANPPSFAHVHCAEALGIPVLLSFTMPWSPTTAFPHPLVNIKQSNAEQGLTNYLSYALADLLTWQGIGDLVNKFRSKSLGLEPLSLRSGSGLADRLKVPWTYCMSPALVPKPDDWKNHIDVVGFYFLDLAKGYVPPADLQKFLDTGPPPIYIGFGSVVVDDAKVMTQTIFDATKRAGTRALVSAGWGGLGGIDVPEHVFILGNVPHDWLFSRVTAVVHHGGAGTAAIGLKMGCPTAVVPFFGDQPFWGAMIHKAGAGPEPIPHKQLNADNLTDALTFLLSPGAKAAAEHMAKQIADENGVERGADRFYKHLPLLNMRCDLAPHHVAVWWSTEYCMKLSAFAAQTLADAKKLNMSSLDPHRSKEYESRKKVTDPVTGGGSAVFWTVTHWYGGIAQIFYNPKKGIINTTTAIPKGVMDIVVSIHEGFQNTPKLYGSEVRESGKVTDFSSGMKEAGKGFFYGYYDGITGLVTEPYKGAKKEGIMGAIKGSARSFVNVTMRPAAGAVGLVAHPMQGAWKSIQKPWAKKQEQTQRGTRLADGVAAVRAASKAERDAVLAAFKGMEKDTKARQRALRELAEKEMYEDPGQDADEETGSAAAETPREDATAEDAAFEREMELAKQLSLAEQRGYERGMASGK